MVQEDPVVRSEGGLMRTVAGTFFRAVLPAHREAALAGSRAAGRYSRPGVPTLYLSSSPAGVAAAMISHTRTGDPDREVLRFHVEARHIADLRDHQALRACGIDPAEAAAEWQNVVAAGGSPSSWRVREALERMGAHGLIDPSRRGPGLWHLALFTWNTDGAPTVRGLDRLGPCRPPLHFWIDRP
ncbi:RES domain-containing protein [Nesterenkonia sandarakina]|uniref:RES domain-containing protein n=2 Tax=Nesterenkonia sandarakina TaxID=272918 RepID=A0A7Z0J467_9MICC|nr:RES domain-containing protein [Nesterenkonia sandarakina]